MGVHKRYTLKKGPLTPRWLCTPGQTLPNHHPVATLPIWLLVVNWPLARTMQFKGLHALLATSCLVFKGHLARFQGFKPAGPFWVPHLSYLGLDLLRARSDPWAPSPYLRVCGWLPFTSSAEARPHRGCLDVLSPSQSGTLPHTLARGE